MIVILIEISRTRGLKKFPFLFSFAGFVIPFHRFRSAHTSLISAFFCSKESSCNKPGVIPFLYRACMLNFISMERNSAEPFFIVTLEGFPSHNLLNHPFKYYPGQE
jgi:hypothetical protein